VQLQRRAVGGGGIVVEGRDIGTTVVPRADVKVFLTASEEVRAARRAAEHSDADPEVTRVDQARRDRLDSSRPASPLRRADDAVVRVLRKAGRPVVLAANEVDDARVEADAAALWSLGLGQPYPVSALHGRGRGDLLDAVLAALPEAPPDRDEAPGGPRRVA